MMQLKKRDRVLGLVIVSALFVLWLVRDSREQGTQVVAGEYSATKGEGHGLKKQQSKADADISTLLTKFRQYRFESKTSSDLFSRRIPPSIVMPPRAALPPLPVMPVAPTIPVFDYVYVGKISPEDKGVDEKKTMLLLSKGEQVLSLSKGDIIDGQFRIDEITSERFVITHLATNTKILKMYDELSGRSNSAANVPNFPIAPDLVPVEPISIQSEISIPTAPPVPPVTITAQ